MTIQLRLTPEQARTVAKGCEILSAIHQGRLSSLARIPSSLHEDREEFATALELLECHITGQRIGCYPAINDCSDEGKVAHDLAQIIHMHLDDEPSPHSLISGIVAPSQLQTVVETIVHAL